MGGELPKVVHVEKLDISFMTLRVYVLEDGRRIVDAKDVQRLADALFRGEDLREEDAQIIARCTKKGA